MADLIKLDADLDIIQKLDDEPNDVGGLSSAELKAEFDKAGNAIKTYLNDTLIPGIEGTGGEGGLVGEQIAAHNAAPDAHADIREEVALKLDSATIKSEGIPEIVSPETLRTYFYEKRKDTSRVWQFEVSTGSNENIINALGGFPNEHTAAEKWFLYIDLPYTEAGGFVIHAQLEGRDNGLLYRQDQFATLDQRWHTTGWIRIQDVQEHLDAHIADQENPHNVTLEQIGAMKAPETPGKDGLFLTYDGSGNTINKELNPADIGNVLLSSNAPADSQTIDVYVYGRAHNKLYIGNSFPISFIFGHKAGSVTINLKLRTSGEPCYSGDLDIPEVPVGGYIWVGVTKDYPSSESLVLLSSAPPTFHVTITKNPDGETWTSDRTDAEIVQAEMRGDFVYATSKRGGGVHAVYTYMGYDASAAMFAYVQEYVPYESIIIVYIMGNEARLRAIPLLPGNGGEGQVLTQTSSGRPRWQDAPDGLPDGGTDGQVLTQTSAGTPEWKDISGGAEAEKWATEAVKDAIPSITDETTFRTHFYELRKSQTRKYQFEISPGGVHENIVTGVGGRPQGASADDSAFIYVEIPFSEAGGYVIHVTYELRSKAGIWEKKIYGTLDSRWQDTGWYEQNAVNAPTHTIMNVDIEDDGFGGYETIDYNDNDINNHRNAGGLVQAKYYDSKTNQTYTYYYSTMESDRKPTFIRTYVDDNGSTVQVLASVGNDKKVTVTRRVTPSIDDASAAPDKLWSAEKISKLSEENDNKFANALNGRAVASIVRLDDVSPVTHAVGCRVTRMNRLDPSNLYSGGETGGLVYRYNAGVVSTRGRHNGNYSVFFDNIPTSEVSNCSFSARIIKGQTKFNGIDVYVFSASTTLYHLDLSKDWNTFQLGTLPSGTVQFVFIGDSFDTTSEEFSAEISLNPTSGPVPFVPYVSSISGVKVIQKRPDGSGSKTFTPDPAGVVTGMTSLSPAMYIEPDQPGVAIFVDYNRDINRSAAEYVKTSYVDQSFANALRGYSTAIAVSLGDVSPMPHSVKCKLTSMNRLDPSKLYNGGEAAGLAHSYSDGVVKSVGQHLGNYSVFFDGISTDDVSGCSASFKIVAGKTKFSAVDIFVFSDGPEVVHRISLNDGWNTFQFGTLPSGTVQFVFIGDSFDTTSEEFSVAVSVNPSTLPVTYSPYVSDVSGITVTQKRPNGSDSRSFTSDSLGDVLGMTSLYPAMDIETDNPGVAISLEYNRDINKAFAALEAQRAKEIRELKNAILSMGGNI